MSTAWVVQITRDAWGTLVMVVFGGCAGCEGGRGRGVNAVDGDRVVVV